MSIPTSFHNITAIMEIPERIWVDLVHASGDCIECSGAEVTHKDVFEFITQGKPGELVLDLLSTLDELGCDDGRECILQCAESKRLVLDEADAVPNREWVASLWIKSLECKTTRKLLANARMHIQILAKPRQCQEFAGSDPKPFPEPNNESLRSAISCWFDENNFKPPVELHPYWRNGEFRCEILVGDIEKRVVEIKENAASPLQYLPGVTVHVRYDPDSGRLGIASKSPRRMTMYRRLFGKIIGGDEDYFSSENICTLEPLKKSGKSLFDDRLPSNMIRVDIVELLWRRGDRDTVIVKGKDCFDVLDSLSAKLTEGKLVHAKLSIQLAGTRRRASVSIKVPNRIDILAGVHEQDIERLLDSVGIRGIFKNTDTNESIWSKYPWRMPEAEWKKLFGGEISELVASGYLKEIVLDKVTHPDHPAQPDALTVISTNDDRFGVSSDLAIPSRTLTETDTLGFQLDEYSIAEHLTEELILSGTPQLVSQGLWRLGTFDRAATGSYCVFLAMREPSATHELEIANAANGLTPVLVVPQGCYHATHLTTIEFKLPTGPSGELLRRLVLAMKLERQVDVQLWAKEDFIIDPKGGKAWYRGVQLTELDPETHAFKFALLVAEARGETVSKSAITESLSPSELSGEVPKKAKARLKKAVEESYSAANIPCPKDISHLFVACSGKGYALNGSAYVLS